MAFLGNLTSRYLQREVKELSTMSFQRCMQVTPDLVRRIGLEAELEGHNGCVNCLEWNEKGTLLASGSDDVQIVVWEPFLHKKLTTVRTGHHGNIFSIKFLPNSNDSVIVSGAADCKIRVHDLNSKETSHVFSCHAGRVKRLAIAPNVPFMFWSAAEDGTIMQFDLRAPETCGPNPQNVLVNLNAHMGAHAEAKCLAINPVRPEQMAVGTNDPYVRIYDRRMLTCKSIKFPSDSGSRFPWDEASHCDMTESDDFSLPEKSVQYYVAGHLPHKQQDYKKRYRTLASTYLTFSPEGNELLVNLGGEQIYLFDVNKSRKAIKLNLPLSLSSNGVVKETSCPSNGYSIHHPGTTNGCTLGLSKHHGQSSSTDHMDDGGRKKKRVKYESKPLHPTVDAIKQKANSVFEKQQYAQAIILYNQAVALAPDAAVLYGNRAAAFMKRGWDGDLYAALRDCHAAIHADQNHLKAHFRLARCLYELSWTKEAADCLLYFKNKFPDYAKNPACEALDRDISAAIHCRTEQDEKDKKIEEERSGWKNNWRHNVSEQEKTWRANAMDYEMRFCGHCNTTTDIKEANFFGSKGQYIVAGSDDGSFFIWEKNTGNIVRVLRGDDSIVNCLQPHPTQCLLATSGIDPVVRLWSPRAEDGSKNEREVDNSDDAASANQKRMNADPLEVMLMNMGYRISGVFDGDDNGDDRGETPQCRPS
ncbi:WD and tetratricopeptide repeats protein 1-like [Lineus longissimus]|uniref:WD and tetratricopeptide repeats protein 1-like n=1 Tax=Lineus longissimus TaxID=88925 RepID=UPI002B4E334D